MKTDCYNAINPDKFDEVTVIIRAAEYLGISTQYLDIGTAVLALRDAEAADREALNKLTGESIHAEM